MKDKVFYDKSEISAIADAIREKTGTTGKLKVRNMPDAIRNISTSDDSVPFVYSGTNSELIYTHDETWTLDDTSFVKGESASTSATSIRAAVTNSMQSQAINVGDKDIIFIQTCIVTPVHSSSATNKAKQEKYVLKNIAYSAKRKTTDTSANTTRQITSITTYINKYYNASGVLSRAVSNYGFYMTPTTPSFSSTTSASPTLRCNSPTLYYRASSIYESTANIVFVEGVTYEWHVEVYALDPQSSIMAQINKDIDDIITGAS